jgi:hypothetical protein
MKLGGELLGCFRSEQKTMVRGMNKLVPVPVEYAFAIALSGGPYAAADLDGLLSRAKESIIG